MGFGSPGVGSFVSSHRPSPVRPWTNLRSFPRTHDGTLTLQSRRKSPDSLSVSYTPGKGVSSPSRRDRGWDGGRWRHSGSGWVPGSRKGVDISHSTRWLKRLKSGENHEILFISPFFNLLGLLRPRVSSGSLGKRDIVGRSPVGDRINRKKGSSELQPLHRRSEGFRRGLRVSPSSRHSYSYTDTCLLTTSSLSYFSED